MSREFDIDQKLAAILRNHFAGTGDPKAMDIEFQQLAAERSRRIMPQSAFAQRPLRKTHSIR